MDGPTPQRRVRNHLGASCDRAASQLPDDRRVRLQRLRARREFDTFIRELVVACVADDLFVGEEAEDLLEWNDNQPLVVGEHDFFSDLLFR